MKRTLNKLRTFGRKKSNPSAIDTLEQTHNLQQLRTDFVANVSHELRTPLTVVKGYLETIKSGLYPPAQFTRMIDQMQKQTLRMEHLITDLLLLSQLENDIVAPDRIEVIDMAHLLQEIKLSALELSGQQKHQIELNIETDAKLMGHRHELYSAFANIVYNAVRYTPENGRIILRWYADNTGTHFSVQDTGIGISEQHIPRLTERFYRVEVSRSRDAGGTGLGLAIVKHVLLRHNGKLYIESELGKGSVFRCDFG